MGQMSVRQKLHEYIDQADENKIHAIFTLVENEIQDRSGIYDEAALNSFRATSAGYFSGKISGAPPTESIQRIREMINKINP